MDYPGLLEAITSNGRERILLDPRFEASVGEFQKDVFCMLNMIFEIACHDQVEPDGLPCKICADSDHIAANCRQNAFQIWKERGYCGRH